MYQRLIHLTFLTTSVLAAGGCSPTEMPATSGGAVAEQAADAVSAEASAAAAATTPYVVVLGISQDGGTPQIGGWHHPAWGDDTLRRLVSSLGLVDPASGARWIFDATPDLRQQLSNLADLPPASKQLPNAGLSGVFLTHAHWGHYTGLGFLGHEVMGAQGVHVFAMPRFAEFLRSNGPWDQLVRYENIVLQELAHETPVDLGVGVQVTPFLVPHRQEYSEVVGFRIRGPQRTVLFLPDIDSWHEWEAEGVDLEEVLAGVDVAYVDATFYADGEVAGRDMSGFPHPFISHTMERLASAPRSLREKVRFIHLNHTNPAQRADSDARATLEAEGYRVAETGEVVTL